MHELGIVFEIIKTVEAIAVENKLTHISEIVLQIGELSSVIPRYIESCYPAAVDGTMLEQTQLRIEILPGNVRCRQCSKIYNLLAEKNQCPNCQSEQWELLSGREFLIKEILAC